MKADRRLLQAGAATLGLVGLLVLVAIGARAGHPIGPARLHQREVPARVGNDLLTLLLITWALGIVVFVMGVLILRREEWEAPKTNWLKNFVLSLLLIGSLLFIGYELVHHGPFRHRRQIATPGGGTSRSSKQTLPKSPTAQEPARFDWEFAVALAGITVLAAAYLAARARRTPEPEAEPQLQDEELEQTLARIVRETIDDLRGETDPRRAVIAAYARMEGILRKHGYGRRPAEAPYEYLQRVLVQLHVAPDAVRELTDLFEYAKFSQHTVGGEMRDRALAAFLSIRDDLRATA